MGFWEWMGFENPRDSPKTEQPKEGLPQVTDNVRDSGQTFVFGRSNAGEQVDEKAAMQIPTVYACVRLLAESIVSFNKNCAVGICANREKMHHNLHNSLMLVTALNPYIGYENAAKTAKKAFHDNISLKEACVELGFLTAEKFDEVFHPEQMV